jgi:(1->4)-alpha-D-glucan 1-alpha-D-glucosylmutase
MPTSTVDERVARLLERLRADGGLVSRRPASTYRLQLTPAFGFRAAAEVAPYLRALGVTDLYLSPILPAAAGSSHGYDVVSHDRLRPELGGEEGFAVLSARARELGLGLIVDFVPNHMGIGPANAWWLDVLENGPSSVHAPFFDVDWQPVKHELQHKVLVPLLGDQYGAVLERGELRLVRDGGAFTLEYFEHRFPISPRSVPRLLGWHLDALVEELGAGDIQLQELLSILTALEKLAPRYEVDPAAVAERAREKEVAKRRLAQLHDASPRIGRHIDEAVAAFNGRPGDARSFDLLAELLDAQAYRLAHWRVAGEEINYRRFFDINSLAAIRMEDERVFAETHRLVLGLLLGGEIAGLRIDHPDGLYTPTAYFRTLQVAFLVERARALDAAAGGDPAELDALEPPLAERVAAALDSGNLPHKPMYVVVEKILEGHERMPASWCVDGTTGYEFLGCVSALYVEPESRRAFDDLYARFIGERLDFAELVYRTKKQLMSGSMASELNVLANRLNRISEADRRTRDFTLRALGQALREYVACLPIYRTYVEGTTAADVDERDRQYIESTIARAQRRAPSLNRSLFQFLRDILLLRHAAELPEEARRDRVELVRKLQQVTGPVTAKALEDSAFYVYQRLVSLNEVGWDPTAFGVSVEEFHRMNRERLAAWPGSLNATSTHDTKRSEDVRLRISALSEIPVEWEARLHRWAALNRPHKRDVDGVEAPDANDELLFYQTLVGAFPDGGDGGFGARVLAYLEKALREAKVRSSWTNPDEGYEAAMREFASRVMGSRAFLDDFVPFQRRVARAARWTTLSQVAIKMASPGVADVYQGCELEDLSLVDPDNRRPVDFALRARLNDELARGLAEGPQARADLARRVSRGAALADGRAKLLLTREALGYRRAEPELFVKGEYLPLTVEGLHARNLIAFARAHRSRACVCVAPRLVLRLFDGADEIAWRARVLVPPELRGPFTDVVTGRRVELRSGALDAAECLSHFPVALLRV